MTRRTIAIENFAGAILAMFVLASAPAEPDDWERLGNQAFLAGRYDEAARCYEKALERSREPGRVAHNQAVSLFNTGHYREAERLFRCELESSVADEHRVRALYDLGTCLLHAAEGRDATQLAEAIYYLTQCIRSGIAETDLERSAKFNLELAKQQWRKIRADSPPPPEHDPGGKEENSKPRTTDQTNGDETGNQSGVPNGTGSPKAVPRLGGHDGSDPIPAAERPPGAGSMSPISDEEQLKPLPPAEARELLRQASERIARERRVLQRASAGSEQRTYPDW
jgi:tetratricopeptide (TPR) repeat protein